MTSRARHLIAFEPQENGKFDCDQIFGIERAAPVQKPIANFSAEWVNIPPRGFDGYHIQMRHQQQRRTGSVSAQSRNDVAAPRCGFQNFGFDAVTRQNICNILTRVDFVAGRIDRIDTNQITQIADSLVAERRPIHEKRVSGFRSSCKSEKPST